MKQITADVFVCFLSLTSSFHPEVTTGDHSCAAYLGYGVSDQKLCIFSAEFSLLIYIAPENLVQANFISFL
jgi:hypothetical protein